MRTDLRALERRELNAAYLDLHGELDGFVVTNGWVELEKFPTWKTAQLALLACRAATNRLAQIVEGARHG